MIVMNFIIIVVRIIVTNIILCELENLRNLLSRSLLTNLISNMYLTFYVATIDGTLTFYVTFISIVLYYIVQCA